MKLATFKTAQGTSYGIVTGKGIVDLKRYIGNRFADLKALIGGNAFIEAAKHANEAPDYGESDITWLPVIPNPDRILCVGANLGTVTVAPKRLRGAPADPARRSAPQRRGYNGPGPLRRPSPSTRLTPSS